MPPKKEKLDYPALIRRLRAEGPVGVYLLWGEEDYLREQFVQELRRACLGENDDGFDYKRIDGAAPDLDEVQEAADAMPFFSDRVFIELRGFDVNKCKADDAERFKKILSSLPDSCTMAIVLPTGYEPDGRLSLVKAVRKHGEAVEFTAQEQGQLLRWIARRMEADGKTISRSDAEYLIFYCGELMTRLGNEISKLTHYVSGDTITRADIEAVTDRTAQTTVFQMTEALAAQEYGKATRYLAELLGSKESPIGLVAMIGRQFRQLFAAKAAQEYRLGGAFVTEICGVDRDYLVRKLTDTARGFSLTRLARAVTLCAETDYAMKSSSADDEELLVDLLLKLAAGDAA